MPRSSTPLDHLLAVLKNPGLAGDFADQPELWSEIKRLADIHRFSGWLAHSSSRWLPPSQRQWRDQILTLHHRRHALRLEALRRLVEAFRNERLACVSLKGPLLAERFYEHPFLRPANDLDILIYEKDVGAAARLMAKLGFQLEGHYPWNLHRRVDKHLDFRSTDKSPRVEVHYCLKAGGILIDATDFLDRSCLWQSPSGFESNVLSAADDAFYSCVHAANHAFHRLRWLYDSIMIARSLTPEERSHVRDLAIAHRQTGRLVATALAAPEFFDESLDLDCSGFSVPWLWRRLTPGDTRNMVVRVEGNTSNLLEKLGCRLDIYRMAGSPWSAAGLFAWQLDLELRKRWYHLRYPLDPEILARTLPV